MEVNQMTNIKEKALAYEASATMNITDLEIVSTDVEIHDEERVNSSGEKYNIKFIVVDDQEYRVPNSVLEQLKTQLEANPELTKFKVTKKGEGMNTTYTVVPLI